MTAASAASVASATSTLSAASFDVSAASAPSAAATPSVEGPADFAHSVGEAEQVVFFMMSFCVFTDYD